MPADNEDIKAKMREALDRKRGGAAGDEGANQKGHVEKGHAEAHGPVGGKREHRRKSG